MIPHKVKSAIRKANKLKSKRRIQSRERLHKNEIRRIGREKQQELQSKQKQAVVPKPSPVGKQTQRDPEDKMKKLFEAYKKRQTEETHVG